MYSHQGYNSARIPALENYDHAKAHFEKTIPIRGRTEECRPLGASRRFSWYEIRKKQIVVDLGVDNPLGSLAYSYVARLYSTDCIEWLPNGNIIMRANGWKSPTTMGFLTHAMRAHGTVQSYGSKWYFVNTNGEKYVIPTHRGGETLMHRGDDGKYRPAVIPQEYKYKAKRKELNRVRKVYETFIEYTKTMLAMDNSVIVTGREVYEPLGMQSQRVLGYSPWGAAPQNRSNLLQKIIEAQRTNDLDLMFKLATYCAYAFGGYSYRGGFKCEPAHFVKGFTEVLKYAYHNEVFEATEQPQGIAFLDTNAKYVSQ